MIDRLALALPVAFILFSSAAMAQAPLCVPPEKLWVPESDADFRAYADLVAADFERQLHPHAPRVPVSGGEHGLAQPQGAQLAAVELHGRELLRRGPEGGIGQIRAARDLQLQGSQFTSTNFTEVLLDAKVKSSMDGRGR